MEKLTRPQMIDLVERLQRGEGDDPQLDEWLTALERSTGNPGISDLIFHPEPGKEDLTAEQIIDQALEYKPFEL